MLKRNEALSKEDLKKEHVEMVLKSKVDKVKQEVDIQLKQKQEQQDLKAKMKQQNRIEGEYGYPSLKKPSQQELSARKKQEKAVIRKIYQKQIEERQMAREAQKEIERNIG